MDNGYGYHSNKWVLDNDIKNELRLLLLLSSRSAIDGFCYSNNNWLANTLGYSKEEVSRKLNKLKNKGYIKIEYKYKDKEVISRKIYVVKDYVSIKNTKEPKVKTTSTIKFIKPTVEQIKEYIVEQENQGKYVNFTAEQFFLHYETVGWTVGKNKMKDWKSAVRNWITRAKTKVRTNNLPSYSNMPKY